MMPPHTSAKKKTVNIKKKLFIILTNDHAQRKVLDQSVKVALTPVHEVRFRDVDLARQLKVDDPAFGFGRDANMTRTRTCRIRTV